MEWLYNVQVDFYEFFRMLFGVSKKSWCQWNFRSVKNARKKRVYLVFFLQKYENLFFEILIFFQIFFSRIEIYHSAFQNAMRQLLGTFGWHWHVKFPNVSRLRILLFFETLKKTKKNEKIFFPVSAILFPTYYTPSYMTVLEKHFG